jgi:ketosteroid isomerase-like protein
MSSRTFQILTVAALTAVVPALTLNASALQSSPKAEIQSNYNNIAAAFKRKDLNGASRYFTPDYVNIDDKGESKTAAQIRQQYAPLLKRVTVTGSRIAIQQFNVEGSQATALVKQRSDLRFGQSKIVREDIYRDNWIKTAQGWRIQKSQTLSVSTTVDGQPVANN